MTDTYTHKQKHREKGYLVTTITCSFTGCSRLRHFCHGIPLRFCICVMYASVAHVFPSLTEWQNALSLSNWSSCCYCAVAQSCLTLWDPMDCSPPRSSIHGISQAKYSSGLPFSSPTPMYKMTMRSYCVAQGTRLSALW